eukprot:2621845-Pyramimonas_sp.AAC.1
MIESRPNARTWKQNKDLKRVAKIDREYFGGRARDGSASGPRPPRPPCGRGGGGRGRADRGRGGRGGR